MTEQTNGDLTLASRQYLRPTTNVGDATLRLTTTKDAEHFILEIFDTKTRFEPYTDPADGTTKQRQIDDCIPPYAIEADRFVENRFKHGHRKISRNGCFHPIYEVPMTDYTVALITYAWKGKKTISEMAKPIFNRIFLREFHAEQNLKRTAKFKHAVQQAKLITDPANKEAEQIKDQIWHIAQMPQAILTEHSEGWNEWKSLQAQPIIDAANKQSDELIEASIPTNDWFKQFYQHLYDSGIRQSGEPTTMKPYQKVGSYNCCMSQGYGYSCDPGLGKTLMMIAKMDFIISHAKRETMTLVVCPKNVRTNWINEIAKYSMHNDKTFVVQLDGNKPIDRWCNLMSELGKDEALGKHVIIISNYESYVQTEMMHELEFDLLLADESHNFANPSTKRTRTFRKLRTKFHNAVIATGTFFRNSPFDAYGQLEILHEGASGMQTFDAFKHFIGIYEPANQYTKREKLVDFDVDRIPLLKERLAKYTFIMKKEEALPFLPKKSFSILECYLSKEQKEVYAQLQDQLIAVIESYGDEPDTMTVNNILTQMLRLAQITSGYAATDGGTITRFDPNPKLDALMAFLLGQQSDEGENGSADSEGCLTDPNNKALVWCAFKENLKMIHSRLAQHGIRAVTFHGSTDDKDEVVTQFNVDPLTRVFIGIAKSGGVGLNLVGFDPYKPKFYKTNTTNVIHYSSNWSYVDRAQADDRAHRYNTRVPIHILDLIVPGSIDTTIYNRVKSKGEMSGIMQDIRKILTAMIPQSV